MIMRLNYFHCALKKVLTDLKFGMLLVNSKFNDNTDPNDLIILDKTQMSNPQYLTQMMKLHGAKLHPSFIGSHIELTTNSQQITGRRGRKRSRGQFENEHENEEDVDIPPLVPADPQIYPATPPHIDIDDVAATLQDVTDMSSVDNVKTELLLPFNYNQQQANQSGSNSSSSTSSSSSSCFSSSEPMRADRNRTRQQQQQQKDKSVVQPASIPQLINIGVNSNNQQTQPVPVRRSNCQLHARSTVLVPQKPPQPIIRDEDDERTVDDDGDMIVEAPKKKKRRVTKTAQYIFKHNDNDSSKRVVWLCTNLSLLSFDSLVNIISLYVRFVFC